LSKALVAALIPAASTSPSLATCPTSAKPLVRRVLAALGADDDKGAEEEDSEDELPDLVRPFSLLLIFQCSNHS
jgi:hypothetical protein